jgi:hypothetical protein
MGLIVGLWLATANPTLIELIYSTLKILAYRAVSIQIPLIFGVGQFQAQPADGFNFEMASSLCLSLMRDSLEYKQRPFGGNMDAIRYTEVRACILKTMERVCSDQESLTYFILEKENLYYHLAHTGCLACMSDCKTENSKKAKMRFGLT